MPRTEEGGGVGVDRRIFAGSQVEGVTLNRGIPDEQQHVHAPVSVFASARLLVDPPRIPTSTQRQVPHTAVSYI